MISSTIFNISGKNTLLSLKTLKPFDFIYLSLTSAFFFLSFPHLYGESTSIQSFLSGKKKSILYGPIGSCIIYFIFNLSKNFLNIISCGCSLFAYVFDNVLALFARKLRSLLLTLDMLIDDASKCVLSLIPVSFANLIKGVCETPASFASLFMDSFFPQCLFIINSSKVIPKCNSIFSLIVSLMNTYLHFNYNQGKGFSTK